MTRGIAVLALASLFFTACGADQNRPATQKADESWGPLAVMESGGADEALTRGTLRLTEDCALLDTGDEHVLLVWPADRTTWNADERTVTLEDFNGERGTAGDGDEIRVGGGGSRVDEGGVPGDEWVESVDWVSAPDESCPTDPRWGVGEGLRTVPAQGTLAPELGELSVEPSSGPIGTEVTLEGERCWAGEGADHTNLAFGNEMSPDGPGTIGTDEIGRVPTDEDGHLRTAYVIPEELPNSIQGEGGGPVVPGFYAFFGHPPRCSADFEVTSE